MYHYLYHYRRDINYRRPCSELPTLDVSLWKKEGVNRYVPLRSRFSRQQLIDEVTWYPMKSRRLFEWHHLIYKSDMESLISRETWKQWCLTGCQPDEPQPSLVTINRSTNVYGFLVILLSMYNVIDCLYSVGNKITTTTLTLQSQRFCWRPITVH